MVAAVPESFESVPSVQRHLRDVSHGHEWRLVADDVDEFGPVRMFACTGCDQVRYA